jgi:hypothetical protein
MSCCCHPHVLFSVEALAPAGLATRGLCEFAYSTPVRRASKTVGRMARGVGLLIWRLGRRRRRLPYLLLIPQPRKWLDGAARPWTPGRLVQLAGCRFRYHLCHPPPPPAAPFGGGRTHDRTTPGADTAALAPEQGSTACLPRHLHSALQGCCGAPASVAAPIPAPAPVGAHPPSSGSTECAHFVYVHFRQHVSSAVGCSRGAHSVAWLGVAGARVLRRAGGHAASLCALAQQQVLSTPKHACHCFSLAACASQPWLSRRPAPSLCGLP